MTSVNVVYWHLTYNDDADNSHKFYDIYVVDKTLTLRWGRVGTNGQYKEMTYPSLYAAEGAARSQASSKVAKGYSVKVSGANVTVELGWYDGLDLATKVERAMQAHDKKPSAAGNRLASITASANEIASATNRKGTAGLLNTWADMQRDWEEISIEYRLAEQAMKEAEQVITARLMGGG